MTQLLHKKLRQNLRQTLRKKRRELSKVQQKKATKQLTQQIIKIIRQNKSRFKKQSITIATYLAGDGEISTLHFENWQSNFQFCFVYPIIQKNKTLFFGRKTRNKCPRINIYKIPEPLKIHQLNINNLDIILLPLVAATQTGIRLGMGGGFYDRTLAKMQKPGPLLIGIAHDFQIISDIPQEPWDKPIDYIATDLRVIRCRQ